MGFKKGSKINVGKIPWNKGKPWSKEVRNKISKSKRGKKQTIKRKVTKELKEIWIKNLYKNGKSPWSERKLTEEHKKKCSEWQKGDKAWNWKGGRYKTNHGYVYIHSPNHPFKNFHGYIFEHRLVMEKHIGRYLTKIEQIHHINGIKDDNRIENLDIVLKKKHYGKINCPFCNKHFLIK